MSQLLHISKKIIQNLQFCHLEREMKEREKLERGKGHEGNQTISLNDIQEITDIIKLDITDLPSIRSSLHCGSSCFKASTLLNSS